MNLKRRLEGLELRVRPAPTRTEIEARELTEEIARLEDELEAEGHRGEAPRHERWGVDSVPSAPAGLTLDEEIEWLEGELEAESWD